MVFFIENIEIWSLHKEIQMFLKFMVYPKNHKNNNRLKPVDSTIRPLKYFLSKQLFTLLNNSIPK